MSFPGSPASDLILFQTEDGKTRIQCRFEDESIWLTQAQIAELYQKDVKTINEHLLDIYEDKELDEDSTIRKFRIVRLRPAGDSGCWIPRTSRRGTLFRQENAMPRAGAWKRG